jgi:hypothetical protein
MKRISHSLFTLLLAITVFFSCEDQVTPELENADPILVVDAWITNRPEPQKIFLTRTQPYFENAMPPGVAGAIVSVEDSEGKVYTFIEDESEVGTYVWTPVGNEVFGEVGLEYTLNISYSTQNFQAFTKMGRVPPVDSINFYREPATQFTDEQYFAEFFADDPKEAGDIYWIKTYKNGALLNKSSEINIAYDAAFSRNGDDYDSAITFISPIRTEINPFDENEDGTFKSPYVVGDSLYVEINSISEDAFDFFNEVIIQTDRPGGFGELFATPLANVPTNVSNVNPAGEKVVGFFNVAAVSGLGRRFNSLDDLEKE